MPIYEYRCETCQKIHEVMQKFSDAPMETCPDCESPVQKQISLSSFALKGTGWYSTDYKKKTVAPVSPSSGAQAVTGASASTPEKPVAVSSTPSSSATVSSVAAAPAKS